MDNFLSMKESEELKDFCTLLGFKKTLFKDHFVIIEGSQKEVLKKVKENRKKFIIYQTDSEEMLRYVLEKVPINMVIGMEKINYKDSVHFLRGGLDQINCKIAAKEGKIIGFSFQDILNSVDKGKIIGRMKYNLKLCKKYKVNTYFGNIASSKEDLRSSKDLAAFLRVLEKNKKLL